MLSPYKIFTIPPETPCIQYVLNFFAPPPLFNCFLPVNYSVFRTQIYPQSVYIPS